MSKVVFDVSVPLDGFVSGPDSTLEQPLGAGVPLLDGTPGRVERTRVVGSPAAVHVGYAVTGRR